jgi:ATP-dependent DNA helicase RecQ
LELTYAVTTSPESTLADTAQLADALRTHFGYDTFRGRQEDVVREIIEGRDAFVIMPTGAGKSLCYQLPALLQKGTALVISPLIALMKNQVDQLSALGIEAGFLNSTMSRGDYMNIQLKALKGTLKLLYVAPETLSREDFIEFLVNVQVSFVAVDEAHCISEWGHDFRPEYRRIRPTIQLIGGATRRIPIVALTATATPKVQEDIRQNLGILDAKVVQTSFNRPNLYYEIRQKLDPNPEIVRYIKQHMGKSGILYCLSRRKVEEMAALLKVNGIAAVPYHAGLDSETRSRHQDMFLNEDVQVVVATIAFGMGIDKPDVRYVIHYDVPKSIESYYQETGRGGRDGLEGNCILFYDYSDIVKLEKFMKDKPVSERDAGRALLLEMAAFCESGMCRRQQILHYFGETYSEPNCGHCDNCRNPKPTFDATNEARLAFELAKATGGRYTMSHLIGILRGSHNDPIKQAEHHLLPQHGQGVHIDENAWKSLLTQLLVHEYLIKDITDYGVIRIAPKGEAWLKKPSPITLVQYIDAETQRAKRDAAAAQIAQDFAVYDEILFDKLKKLTREVGKKNNVPPHIVFLEPALQEMATKFPINLKELERITGVNAGKAQRFGAPFAKLIAQYVEENEITRPEEVVIKSQGKNSSDKLYFIQQIDRKVPLDEIADQKNLPYDELLDKLEQIVSSGSKLNLDYYVKQTVDPDKLDELFDYFRTATSPDLEAAHRELGTYYSTEEIKLAWLKFYVDFAI